MRSLSHFDKDISLKWKKYELLTIWNLRDKNELLSTIRRYRINNIENFFYEIDHEIVTFGKDYIFIVKMICNDSIFKLPNFIITTRQDLVDLKNKQYIYDDRRFSEIWYCKNQINSKTIYGRILLSLSELLLRTGTKILEVVWGNTARLIEQYPNLHCTYASVELNGWGENYNFIDIIKAGKSTTEIKNTINTIIELLYRHRKEIMDFGNFIHKCGCSTLSIEFSYSADETFLIIDWDSDNDLMVLNKILY